MKMLKMKALVMIVIPDIQESNCQKHVIRREIFDLPHALKALEWFETSSTVEDKPKFFDLNELECRLLTPKIAFQKLTQAPRGRQLKLHGNIVHVPVDVTHPVSMLPWLESQTAAGFLEECELQHILNIDPAERNRPLSVFRDTVNIVKKMQWLQLLRILGQLVGHKQYTDEELENFNWEDRRRFIQSSNIQLARDSGKLVNVEISAQEAVYIVLQLPLRKASQQIVFINTSLPDEKLWNSLPSEVRLSPSLSSFKDNVSKHLKFPTRNHVNYLFYTGDDSGIPLVDLNTEPLLVNELQDHEYRHLVHSLNKEQKEGKSNVTKALYQVALKYYNSRAGDNFAEFKALMLASTGKAAYNIKGNTIHSALAIPACQSLKIYKPLDSSRLSTLRCKLGVVKLIFIDEISMKSKVNDFNSEAHNALSGTKYSIMAQDGVIGVQSQELLFIRDNSCRQLHSFL
ncbi:hypothetical protein P5673_031544 [Acropora cervicornis]|uniref:DNA helicase n=1 Tax=Acropora cervicornis TaxID=6130 RepID=A0AAD9PSM6_ACRCE|nr:hypothetical protein P5673_031544 [Acropora cervicornis]